MPYFNESIDLIGRTALITGANAGVLLLTFFT